MSGHLRTPGSHRELLWGIKKLKRGKRGAGTEEIERGEKEEKARLWEQGPGVHEVSAITFGIQQTWVKASEGFSCFRSRYNKKVSAFTVCVRLFVSCVVTIHSSPGKKNRLLPPGWDVRCFPACIKKHWPCSKLGKKERGKKKKTCSNFHVFTEAWFRFIWKWGNLHTNTSCKQSLIKCACLYRT